MKSVERARWLGGLVLWGALAAGCSSGAYFTARQPPYLRVNRNPAVMQAAPVAQGAPTDCRPWDSSMVCCIKKFPLSPVESCAAASQEVLETLNGLKMAMDAGDFANNAALPEWKQRCIRLFVDCQNEKWTGSCYDCLRYCEGQRDWPQDKCRPRKKGK